MGFVTFLLPICAQPIRAFSLPIHTFFGVVIFCLAVATALMGMTEKLIWALYVAVDFIASHYITLQLFKVARCTELINHCTQCTELLKPERVKKVLIHLEKTKQ